MADYETEAEAPLDPAAERLRRKLVRLLLGSGLIMMLGLIAVFAAIVYKTGLLQADAGGLGQAAAPLAAGEHTIAVPAGARVVSVDLDGGRAMLNLETADGSGLLLVLDLASGSVLGRYALAQQ